MSHDSNQKGPEARVPAPAAPSTQLTERSTGLKLVGVRAAADSLNGDVPSHVGPFPMQAASAALLGYTIDNRYKVESVLGEGGMGVVYRCRHKIIDKKVAMKVLRADLARDHEVTERFLTEAKAASAIGDEHIIDISDFGLLPDGSAYFVMEYLDGQPLSGVLHGNQPVPIPRLLHIALQLAEGLAAAHDAKIVHRDLKPDNIFLITRGSDKDFVKILDFGIAKVSTGGTAGQLTRAGSVFGTPHYMSPEQAAGAQVDHRGDVYSFGVILYELACGRVPFDADNFMGILTQHMYKAPVPIRALVPPPQDVPPGLEAVILKCLSKRPEQRYSSMRELMGDLEKLRNGLVPEAVSDMMTRSGGFNVPNDFFKVQGRMPAPVPATPVEQERRRWPLLAGAAGIAVTVGLAVAIFMHGATSPASPPVSTTPPASTVAAPPTPATASDVVPTLPVAIAVEPLDAEVIRDGVSLGTSPIVVGVPEGKIVELLVNRPGYVSQRLNLDGKQSKMMVRLEHEKPVVTPARPRPQARPPTPPPAQDPPKPRPRPQVGGGEIVNPWAK